jgi:hypothetical protein
MPKWTVHPQLALEVQSSRFATIQGRRSRRDGRGRWRRPAEGRFESWRASLGLSIVYNDRGFFCAYKSELTGLRMRS